MDTPTPSTKEQGNFLAISILTAAIIIGGSILYSTGAVNPSLTAQVSGTPPAPAPALATIDDDVVLGSANAPVTLIIFGDYQCPFCKQMYDQTESQLRKEYVDTGKLKIVYRDFPLERIHPLARPAAEAAQCAADQNKYWDVHDYLFDHQDQLPIYATDQFTGVARALNMDVKAFESCVASRKYRDEVQKDLNDGIAAGVDGTPASIVNGKLISGALPYETFKSVIDAAVAEAR